MYGISGVSKVMRLQGKKKQKQKQQQQRQRHHQRQKQKQQLWKASFQELPKN